MTRLAILMDPIGTINIKKDSSFAMLLAAQARGWDLLYLEQGDLFLRDSRARARLRPLQLRDDPRDWYRLQAPRTLALDELDILLMRKDPPVDLEYFASTYILEAAEAAGVLVVNRPASLRDVNEKLYTTRFPQCCAPTLVSRAAEQLREFIAEQEDVILKPLYAMGGSSIYRVRRGDPNTNVIIESLTDQGRTLAMAQRFIPEISAGDKRILLIDGEPVPYALARIPAAGETRGNLAVGGRGVGVELTERDRWICTQVAPTLRAKGLYFVGLDVIGDYLTEINVTSPTCIRELDREYGLDIAGELMDCLAGKLHDR